MMTFLAFIGGLGWPELLVIGGIVLLVFGPKRLPEIAESFGKSINKFKSATKEAQDDVKREINAPPIDTEARSSSSEPVDAPDEKPGDKV
jgi:sec-independent protein translocase protein TatA